MSAIRCIDCGRAVHPEVGGAWCREHRPVDLTGERWDPALLLSTRTGDHRVRVMPRVRRGVGAS